MMCEKCVLDSHHRLPLWHCQDDIYHIGGTCSDSVLNSNNNVMCSEVVHHDWC